MAGDIDRDRDLEGLLKRTLRAGDRGPALSPGLCLDPEQFAAWADGSLSADDARTVELHLSDCARCQAMAAAFAASAEPRSESAEGPAGVSANVVPIAAKRQIRWMLPMAAGTIAATLLVWFGTRSNQPQPEAQMAAQSNVTPSVTAPAPSAAPAVPAAPADTAARSASPLADASRELRKQEQQSKSTNRLSRADAQQGQGQRAEPSPVPPPPPPQPVAPAAAPVQPPAGRATFRSGVDTQTVAAATSTATVGGVVGGVGGGVAERGLAADSVRQVATAIAEFSSPPAITVTLDGVSVAPARGGAGAGVAAGGRGGTGLRTTGANARGSIEGTARDRSGVALPGATILARDLGTGATSTVVTDNRGSFRLSSLAPGRYSVTASLTGFVQFVVDNVVVEDGRASQVDFPLAVGALSETVTVNRAQGGAGGGGRGGAIPRDAVAKPAELDASGVTRWRIHSDNRVERSRDAGLNWQRALVDVGLPPIRTGVAASANVCWLIGRAGLVLVTSDALTFRRAATPANVDLLSVQATDALNAIVTAADGRKFTTADGGLTWK